MELNHGWIQINLNKRLPTANYLIDSIQIYLTNMWITFITNSGENELSPGY